MPPRTKPPSSSFQCVWGRRLKHSNKTPDNKLSEQSHELAPLAVRAPSQGSGVALRPRAALASVVVSCQALCSGRDYPVCGKLAPGARQQRCPEECAQCCREAPCIHLVPRTIRAQHSHLTLHKPTSTEITHGLLELGDRARPLQPKSQGSTLAFTTSQLRDLGPVNLCKPQCPRL